MLKEFVVDHTGGAVSNGKRQSDTSILIHLRKTMLSLNSRIGLNKVHIFEKVNKSPINIPLKAICRVIITFLHQVLASPAT